MINLITIYYPFKHLNVMNIMSNHYQTKNQNIYFISTND